MEGIEVVGLVAFLSATAGYLFGLARRSSRSIKLGQEFTEAMFHAAIVHGLQQGIIELTNKGLGDEGEDEQGGDDIS